MKAKIINRNKCLIWTRVSSQEQLDNGSLNTQLTICTDYAKKLGFQVIHHESAYESAKKENMKFKQMMKKLTDKRNKYDALIVLSASRFSRYLPVASTKLVELNEKGIHLYVQRGNLSSEDDTGVINLYKEFLKANEENHERKEITVISRLAKLKQGVTVSKPPIGYVTSSRKGRLDENNQLLPSIELCPEKAPLMKKAFRLILQKKTITEVDSELSRFGLVIGTKYLGELLRKPIYCGKLVDKTLLDAGIPYVMGKHEKIISVSEFEQVQRFLNKKALKKKKKTNEDEIPINGILKCYKCHNNLSGYLTKGIAYYKCNHGCKLNVSGKNVHDSSLQLLRSLELNSTYTKTIQDFIDMRYNERYADLIQQHRIKENELAKLQMRLENLLLSKLDGDIDESTYRKIKKETETKINIIESDMVNLKVPKVKNIHDKVMSLLENPILFYEKLKTYEKKAFLKTVITDGLTYDKDKKGFEGLKINEMFRLQARFSSTYSIAA
jgi:site-specific DNA recombinase